MEHHHRPERCVICERSVVRGVQRHLLTREILEENRNFADYVLERINLEQAVMNENQFLCHRCWIAANRARPGRNDNDGGPVASTITLNEYKRIANTSSRCMFIGCASHHFRRVPQFIKVRILSEFKVYVTPNARICQEHFIADSWEELSHQATSNFNQEHIHDMLETLISAYKDKIGIDFDNFQGINEEELHFYTGLTHTQFRQMLSETPLLQERSNRPNLTLGAYLMKIRSGGPNERLSSYVCLSRTSFERHLAIARECLSTQFVPRHLGFDHISRDEIIQHNLSIPNALYSDPDSPRAVVVMDATYIYIQKSSNFLFQKNTYSLHKYRNLLKPFLIVCSDGYIIDITGPHGALLNDATILNRQLNVENAPFHYLFEENDVFILDRGFRDSVRVLESFGYEAHIPPTKDRNADQLSTMLANEVRLVTIVRWVVEVINGWLKRDFKILRTEYFNRAMEHLFVDVRICGAILNAFRQRLRDSLHSNAIIDIIRDRVRMPNNLADFITENNINRQRVPFLDLNNENLQINFPVLSEEDLILFSLGTYQVRLARSYVQEQMRDGIYHIEVCEQPSPRLNEYNINSENCTLLRVRIKSRHVRRKIYYSYILVNNNENGRRAINNYYCSCYTGRRTIGTCAHVMSIVWFFGWARHQDDLEGPASFLDGIIIDQDL